MVSREPGITTIQTPPLQRTVVTRPGSGRGRWLENGLRVVAYLVLIVGAISMILPLLWMVTTSLKTLIEANGYPPTWIPSVPQWGNYVELFQQVPFAQFIFNSFKVSVLAVLGQLLTTSMAGFVFARLKFRGREVLFILLLITLMIPPQVTLIPQYLIFRELGWINTHLALIMPFWFGGAFGTFLMRQYFLAIPQDLVDAAKLDGCTPFRMYWEIFLPLSVPALAALAIFVFLERWNDLLQPLIYLNSIELMTVTMGISYFLGQYYADTPLLIAASCVGIVPTIIVFLLAQRYFIQGVVMSGLKG
jgi:multiple sugar transport system permease protein